MATDFQSECSEREKVEVNSSFKAWDEVVECHSLCILLVTACLSHGQLTSKEGKQIHLLRLGAVFTYKGGGKCRVALVETYLL